MVVPHNAALLREPAYLDFVLVQPSDAATLPYGQAAVEPGFYIMEMATGLGATTGVDLILAHTGEHPLQGLPQRLESAASE